MSKQLDHYAFITGATGAIGSAIAIKLATQGLNIIAHYHSNEQKALALKNSIEQLDRHCELIQINLANQKQLEETLNSLSLSPKVVINCAGINIDTLFTVMSQESFDEVMKINLYAPFTIMKWAGRYMSRARAGKIVNISSVSGVIGNSGQASYSASKAGLNGLTKTLAKELAPRNVYVNAIAAGLIESPMAAKTKEYDRIIDLIPMGREGRPQEVANLTAFLCSDESSYLTGQILGLNGGLLTV